MYVSFCSFTAHNFESFLLPLQKGEPMIHQLFLSLCKLLNDIQSKFIKKKKINKLFSDLESNICIDVSKKENLKPLNLIDIEWARCLLAMVFLTPQILGFLGKYLCIYVLSEKLPCSIKDSFQILYIFLQEKLAKSLKLVTLPLSGHFAIYRPTQNLCDKVT